jgi:hypothetical protein
MPGLGNQHFLSLLTQEARLQPHERARAAGALLQQSGCYYATNPISIGVKDLAARRTSQKTIFHWRPVKKRLLYPNRSAAPSLAWLAGDYRLVPLPPSVAGGFQPGHRRRRQTPWSHDLSLRTWRTTQPAVRNDWFYPFNICSRLKALCHRDEFGRRSCANHINIRPRETREARI